jgi:hypothetical protein
MRYLLYVVYACLFLTGCSAYHAYRVDKGESDGIKYCRKGKVADDGYYRSFYDAFLLENLRRKER